MPDNSNLENRGPSFLQGLAWATERLIQLPLQYSNLLEFNARREIAFAINKDRSLKNPKIANEASKSISEEIKELEARGVTEDNALAKQDRDEAIVTRFRKEGDSWIAEELGPDNKLISQARIGSDGTKLTLNFSGGIYKRIGGEIEIDNSDKFPNGSVAVFKLLVGTLKNKKSESK